MANEIANGSFWMPPQASTVASDVDGLFDFILWLNVFFFVAITVAVIYFVVKYRRKSNDQLATSQVGHNTLIESAWTFIPLVLVIAIFVWGFKVFLNLHVAPADAYEVRVTAQAWSWQFTYPTGKMSGTLNVPAGKPVKLVMSSRDLLHSFFVPDFRVKQDVIPGRYTTLWFEAPEVGKHQIFCTEYCGAGHSAMLSEVDVMTQADFDKWVQDSGGTPEQKGEETYKTLCKACHSLDGTRVVGPSFKGVFGREEKLQGGGTVKVDENYLRESILQPNAKIVDTYPAAMPSFQGQLKDDQIDNLIAYLKTLK